MENNFELMMRCLSELQSYAFNQYNYIDTVHVMLRKAKKNDYFSIEVVVFDADYDNQTCNYYNYDSEKEIIKRHKRVIALLKNVNLTVEMFKKQAPL